MDQLTVFIEEPLSLKKPKKMIISNTASTDRYELLSKTWGFSFPSHPTEQTPMPFESYADCRAIIVYKSTHMETLALFWRRYGVKQEVCSFMKLFDFTLTDIVLRQISAGNAIYIRNGKAQSCNLEHDIFVLAQVYSPKSLALFITNVIRSVTNCYNRNNDYTERLMAHAKTKSVNKALAVFCSFTAEQMRILGPKLTDKQCRRIHAMLHLPGNHDFKVSAKK